MNAWFVYDYYRCCGTKAEEAVMKYAVDNYRHMLIYDRSLDAVMESIKAYHAKVLEENRRFKPVDIHMTDERYDFEGHRRIMIGSNSLALRKVRDVIE